MNNIDEDIKVLAKKANIPGISLAILSETEKKIIYHGFSNNTKKTFIDKNTIYVSASLSKPVFAYGVLKLVEMGKLNLDKPLIKYIGINKIDKTLKKDKRCEKITSRMVLSHTSGLQNDGSNTILFDPGERFLYSGDGFSHLQHAVEVITNGHINDFMTKFVFIPFNMNNSSYTYKKKYNDHLITPHDQYGDTKYWEKDMKMNIKNTKSRGHVAGGLFTTAGDYCNFLIGLSEDEEVSKMMVTPQMKLANNIYWGLGVGVEMIGKGKRLWHWGDSLYMRHFMTYDPEKGEGFVSFTNSFHGMSIIDSLSMMIYEKKFKSVSMLKWLTEGRYLHEQFDDPLRIDRHRVLDEFLSKGVEKGMEKYEKWINDLSYKNKDQKEVLVEEFNIWLNENNRRFVSAIKSHGSFSVAPLC